MTSIKDVAREAGVSIASVSRVLAGKSTVNPEIRKRVLAAVKKLGYRRNQAAHNLRTQRTNTIGLLVTNIEDPFFSSICRSIEDAALKHGYTLFICNTDEDPERERLYLELMQAQNVAGIICSPTGANASHFQEIIDRNIPLVCIDRRIDGVDTDTVVLNNQECARRLTEHLLQHNPQRIAGVFGLDVQTGEARLQGFEAALQAAGFSQENVQICSAKATFEGGYQAVADLLSQSSRPDCLIVCTTLLAAGAYKAICDSALTIPQDITFAGFVEADWTSFVNPRITVIEQPTFDIGQNAMDCLLQRLAHPESSTRDVILKGQLVIRQSCGCDASLL